MKTESMLRINSESTRKKYWDYILLKAHLWCEIMVVAVEQVVPAIRQILQQQMNKNKAY